MGTPAIEVQAVSKRYVLGREAHRSWTFRDDLVARLTGWKKGAEARARRELWALEDVSFEVAPGEAIALIGRNGAGKSTALKIMSRITHPTSGRVIVRGRVGSLLEVGTGFHPELTGRENVFMNGAILGMSRAEIVSKFDEIVAFSGLERFIDTPVKRYSSGMQMRLAFSVAAHLDPEVMLVDEVLAVGDQEFQNKCFGRMSEIGREGRTVVFISHNMGAVKRLCTRSILLNGGRVIADGPTADVMQTYFDLIVPDEETMLTDNSGPRLVSWSVESPDAGTGHAVMSGDKCSFSFIANIPRELRHVHAKLELYSSDGILALATSSMGPDGSFTDLSEGSAEVIVDLPGLPLSPGLYQLHLSLIQRGEGTIESWHVQPGLRVLDDRPIEEDFRNVGLLNLDARTTLRSGMDGPAEPSAMRRDK